MSDYPPPSYEAASYRKLWPIVAPYVNSDDLLSACLVSQEWHRSFAPQLWGNPSDIFGSDLDAVNCKYNPQPSDETAIIEGILNGLACHWLTRVVSFSRFRRLLPVARLEVRSLTYILHLRPVEAEFHERPKAVWLRDILDQLPSLKTLIAPKLSFFDHQTLQAVHQKYGEPANGTAYRLKMLIATGCQNITGAALGPALPHFPDLIYLDLSSSQGVRSPQVLRQIGELWDLKILKLRGCDLRNEDTEFISFPRSLLSLDINKNLFSPRGISQILGKLPQAIYGPPPLTTPRYFDLALREEILAGGLEQYVRDNLTHRADGHLLIEEWLPLTFSQLAIVGNDIDVDGITKSLNHLSLDHLDCGSIPLYQEQKKIHANGSRKALKLNLVVFASSFGNLRSLRIHHAIITASPFFGTEIISSDELEHGLESSTQVDSLQLIIHQLLHHQRATMSGRNSGRLKPTMLSNLKVLILTDLPSKTKYMQLPDSLIMFIQECAESEELARLEYLSQIQDLKRPPNWGFCTPKPLKLQKLILEISSMADHYDASTQKQTQNKLTKSSTEDPDSELFMQAAEGDFSFFSENDDASQLVREGRVDTPAFGYDRSILQARSEENKWLDVIPAISAFRKESKHKHVAAAEGKSDYERVVSGHWIGEIKVVRDQ